MRSAAARGVDFHILQQGPVRRELAHGFGVASGAEDLYQPARIMRGLDLVISCDSMPAHLAGALGVPVWTLLHREADWRWLDGRDDSPWYPGMRLFRQDQAGDWASVVARVAAALKDSFAPLSVPTPRATGRRTAGG